MQSDDTLTILDSAVDWLTVTAKRGVIADNLIALADGLLHQSISEGNRISAFRSNGYRGWRTRGVTYGRRDDGALCTLTSREAAMNWKQVLGASNNVSRCDLQITCSDSTQNAHRAEDAYRSLLSRPKRKGRPIHPSIRLNAGGGDTLYLGKPSSDVIGRFYDKGVEQKIAPAGACWRLEAQFRREQAQRAIGRVAQSEAHHDCIALIVATWFSDRGLVVPPIERPHSIDALQYEGYYFSKRETDDERSLKWLGTYVASTVKRLVDSGKRDAVMAALGLTDREQ